ncbi:MAG: Gfo/Idh/MocA family oxidoreductase [Hyphomicrobiaceae bacterium]
MTQRDVGVIFNGATGRLAQHQHLRNALMPIIAEGGIPAANGDRISPRLLLVGRDSARLKAVSDATGILDYTTDLNGALDDKSYSVYFDVASTGGRAERLRRAIAAGKHIYTDKPLAGSLAEAVEVVQLAEQAGCKHGMVVDKIFLPGLIKLKQLFEQDFFGRVLSIRLEFGWWIFDGETQPGQRASWNYQKDRGGGLALDMFPHWSYIIEHLAGRPTGIYCETTRHIPQRWDETGTRYDVDVEDAAYALMDLDNGAKVQVLTSWSTRIRRDDMMTIQVDGTLGSAVASLRDCWTQTLSETPTPTWPQLDVKRPRADHFSEWTLAPGPEDAPPSFRVGWEAYLRHISDDAAFSFPLQVGARALNLIEVAYRSAAEGRRFDVPALEI